MEYLLLFEELFIKSRVSGSGKTVEVDNILNPKPSSTKSLSSSLLLKRKLKREEFTSMVKSLGIDTKNLKNLNIPSDKMEDLKISLNNVAFLKDKLKKDGVLKCEYCNKGPLIIYDAFYNGKDSRYIKHKDFVKSNGATADHRDPKSKGGDKFDFNNLSVSCFRCNNDKKDIDYDTWMNNLKRGE